MKVLVAVSVGLLVVVEAPSRMRRVPWRRPNVRRADTTGADLVFLAQLLIVALSSGMGIERALVTCAQKVGSAVAAEIAGVLRRARRVGLAAAAASHDGPAAEILQVLGRAIVTGAPAVVLVQSYAHEQRAAAAAAPGTRARRLPLQLSIPLSLLVLPGFVVLVMGPTVLVLAGRMLAPLGGL